MANEGGELIILETGPKHSWLCGGYGRIVVHGSPEWERYATNTKLKANMIGHSGHLYLGALRGAKLMYDTFAGQKLLYRCKACGQFFRRRPGA